MTTSKIPHTDHLSDGVEYEEGCPACKPSGNPDNESWINVFDEKPEELPITVEGSLPKKAKPKRFNEKDALPDGHNHITRDIKPDCPGCHNHPAVEISMDCPACELVALDRLKVDPEWDRIPSNVTPQYVHFPPYPEDKPVYLTSDPAKVGDRTCYTVMGIDGTVLYAGEAPPPDELFKEYKVIIAEKLPKDAGRDKRHPSIRETILGEAGYLSDELYGSGRVNPDAYAELMYTWLGATNDRRTPAKVVLSIGKCLKAISAISKDPHNTENYISLAANAAIAGEHAQRSKPVV